jgi:hypothetical protein
MLPSRLREILMFIQLFLEFNMKVADIANEFYIEFGSPSDLPVPTIAYWVRNNIGQLNSVTNSAFYIDATTLEILRLNPEDRSKTEIIEIAVEEKDVYKAIFQVYFIDREIRKNILSYTAAPVIEVAQDGNTIRMTSPTEIGRSLYAFRKAGTDALKDAITAYKVNKARPRQVAGDDTVEGALQTEPIYRRVFDNLFI